MNISSKITVATLIGLMIASPHITAKSQPFNSDKYAHDNEQESQLIHDITQTNENHQKAKTNQSGVVLKSVQPLYPAKAQLAGIEGFVELTISVDEQGEAASVIINKAKPSRVFEEATLNSLKKWRFQQKIVDGKAVPYQLTQTIEFKLKNYTFNEVANLYNN
jgi:TonB family protein